MNMNNRQKNTYVKNQILTTLLATMQSGTPFDDIVISQIIEDAGVARASFYRNYSSLKDVLQKESDRLIAEWGGKIVQETPEGYSKTLISLLNFLKKHADFYLLLCREGLSDIVMNSIISCYEITEDMPDALAYLQSSLAYMVYGWIHEWMHRGMKQSGTQLARMMEQKQVDFSVSP